MDKLTCGEAIAYLLKDYGVETVFGIPGVHTLELYRGITNSGIRHVLARNECGAGFMADGYARATGKPGVCIVISGPGVTNITTPLGQAYNASIPMLVVSSVTRSDSLGMGWGDAHEVREQIAVTRPLTGLSLHVEELDQVTEVFSQAFQTLNNRRPRPVHIEIPIDLLKTESASFTALEIGGSPKDENLNCDPLSFDMAAELLSNAQNPMVLCGAGCKGSESIVTLIEKIQSPVFTSNSGKGILSEDHPLSLGCSISRAPILEKISNADVLFAVGTELSDADNFTTGLPINGKLIRVDMDPSKLNDRYQATVAINGDVEETCREISSRISSNVFASDASERYKEVKRLLELAFAPEYDAENLHHSALKGLRSALPTGSLIFADMAQVAYSGCLRFHCNVENEWHFAGGFGALGAALPQAIGAKIADCSANVSVLIGDGGLMFTLPEVMVAVDLELSIPIIVWENSGFAEIRDEMTRNGIAPFAVRPTFPNLLRLSESFGCNYEKVNNSDTLEEAVKEALTKSGPTFVHVSEREFIV